MLLLILGLIIKKDNNKNPIEKYKKLRILGYLPFIGVLCFGIYSAIVGGVGFPTSYSDSTWIEDFLGSIFIISLFVWPLYIIGFFLIIKSSSKIKN